MWYVAQCPTPSARRLAKSAEPVEEVHGRMLPRTNCPRCGDRASGEAWVRISASAEDRLKTLRWPRVVDWAAWGALQRQVHEITGAPLDAIGPGGEIGAPRGRLRIASARDAAPVFCVGLQYWMRETAARDAERAGLRGLGFFPATVRSRQGGVCSDFVELQPTTSFPLREHQSIPVPCSVCGRVLMDDPPGFVSSLGCPGAPMTPVIPDATEVDVAWVQDTQVLLVNDAFCRVARELEWWNIGWVPLDDGRLPRLT